MKILELKNIKFHSRIFRDTKNISKASIDLEPRMYGSSKIEITQNRKFKVSFTLPEDLKEKIKTGEIKLIVPKDGLNIYSSTDLDEKLKSLFQKERRQIIHSARRWSK